MQHLLNIPGEPLIVLGILGQHAWEQGSVGILRSAWHGDTRWKTSCQHYLRQACKHSTGCWNPCSDSLPDPERSLPVIIAFVSVLHNTSPDLNEGFRGMLSGAALIQVQSLLDVGGSIWMPRTLRDT